jgi:hypothetical protein
MTASAGAVVGIPAVLPELLAKPSGDTSSSLPACGPGPLAQDYTVVFHETEEKLYIEGTGLIRLDDGALLAIVPVVPRSEWTKELRVSHSHIHLVRSDDHGRTWQPVSKLPYYSARPWTYQGRLYLFVFEPGPKKRNDNMLLVRSDDGGRSWSKPVTLFQGHFWNCQTSLVIRDERLYWAVDDISLGTIDKRTQRVIAGDLSGDPMNAAAWRMSEPSVFPGVPDLLSNPKFAKLDDRVLEPNLIEVRGQLRVLACVKINNQTLSNLCAVFDVHDDGRTIQLRFLQYHPMPGGQLKFCILRDEVSKMFWATANFAVDSQEAFDWWDAGRKQGDFRPTSTAGDDRRLLMLLYSLDGLNWFQAGCVAQAAKISQSFMYAAPVIDGDDLAIVCRSSVAAPHQHDADYATFHRVKDFRRLALNLFPQVE